MKKIFTKNSWILFGIFAAGFLIGGLTMWSQITFTREVVKTAAPIPEMSEDLRKIVEPQIDAVYKTWECKQLITCEPADWIGIDGHGKAKPEDYCTYEYKTIMSPENPINFPGYGAYCKEI